MSRPTADEAAPDDSHWKPASGAKLPVVVRLSSDASWLLLPNADARLIGPEPSLSDMITFTSGRGSEHARNVECPAAVQDQVIGGIGGRRFEAARTAEFVEPDQSDSTSPVLFEKIFLFSHPPNHL